MNAAFSRKTAEVTSASGTYQIHVEDGVVITAPRTTSRDIKRHKASAYKARRHRDVVPCSVVLRCGISVRPGGVEPPNLRIKSPLLCR
jgi:hypothetical protein